MNLNETARRTVIQNNEGSLITEHIPPSSKGLRKKVSIFRQKIFSFKYSKIQKQAGGLFEMSSAFEVVRDRMQIFNVQKRQ